MHKFHQQMRPLQNQRLVMHQHMQNALKILQLPISELSEFLHQEIESNPLLEIDLPKKKNLLPRKYNQTTSLIYKKSLYEHLFEQAKLHFRKKEDLFIANSIIGNLDEKGFFTAFAETLQITKAPIAKIEEVLQIIQTFDPVGIAATNLQESLLLQLNSKNKQNSLAHKLIKHHFDDVIHYRLKILNKKMKLPLHMIERCIQNEIRSLCFYPASEFFTQNNPSISPDIIITKKDDTWVVETMDSELPKFTIYAKYIDLLKTSNDIEEKKYVREKMQHGFWLKRAIYQRKNILEKIAKYILKKQKDYFENLDSIKPLTIREMASFLKVHMSTILRAISYKYVCVEGKMISFRSLFSKEIKSSNYKSISTQATLDFIEKWIHKENKNKPLSDQQLVEKLREKGIQCARRTVTKYRRKLRISSAHLRKRLS